VVHRDAVHSSHWYMDQQPRFNENEAVRDDLNFTAQLGTSGHDWVAALSGKRRDACGCARGGSLELSLEITPVAPSRRGLHLRDL
jgi:hypothetical protein